MEYFFAAIGKMMFTSGRLSELFYRQNNSVPSTSNPSSAPDLGPAAGFRRL
jgi:hypothetical protein